MPGASRPGALSSVTTVSTRRQPSWAALGGVMFGEEGRSKRGESLPALVRVRVARHFSGVFTATTKNARRENTAPRAVRCCHQQEDKSGGEVCGKPDDGIAHNGRVAGVHRRAPASQRQGLPLGMAARQG
jgi:hypothetical protein